MSRRFSGFGVLTFPLVGALAVFSVAGPGAATAVTLAYYESSAWTSLTLTGARAVDGTPVGTDAVRRGGGAFGGENYQELTVRDADGNDLDPVPPGIAEANIDNGSLFDAGYRVSAMSYIFDYGETFSFGNVSADPLHASFHLDRRAFAEAFSTVVTATAAAEALNLGADLYIQNAAGGYSDAESRLSPEAVAALRSDLAANARSDGGTRVTRSIVHDFDILLDAGDTFYADFFFMPSEGGLANTPAAPSPVPLPAGAPLLLVALGGLAAARRWRDPAR